MRLNIVLLALVILTLTFVVLTARSASCNWCVATFCGSSSECPGNCVCAIPWGSATGHCTGSQ